MVFLRKKRCLSTSDFEESLELIANNLEEDVMRSIYCLFLVFYMALTRSSSAMSFPNPIVGVLLFLTFVVVKATLRFLRRRWPAHLNTRYIRRLGAQDKAADQSAALT